MRTIPSAELDLWMGDGVREFRARVRRPDEASWTDLSDILGGDWVLRIRTEGENPDQPAGTFTVTFLKHATEGSLSPGISASSLNLDAATEFRPMVHPGRPIEVDARVGDGSTWEPWRLWLQGEMDDVEWPGNEIAATCRTLDGMIIDAQIEAEEESGAADPGNPVEDEIQDLLDRWLADPPMLLTVGAPGWNVGTYLPPKGSLGNHVRGLAQARGWDLRYRWYETDSDYRLTLYLPPRDKVTPDLLLSTTDMIEVAGLRQSRLYVRNAFPIVYDGGSTEVTDPDSILEYRRRAMPMEEPDLDAAEATALATYAKSDLAWPLIDGRYRIPFLPWLELHDLLTLEADDDHFDYDTDFAVVGIGHEVDSEAGAWTYLDLRGGAPVGQYLSWIARSRTPAEDVEGQLTDRKVGRTESEVTLQGTPGSRVAEVWAYEALVEEPFDPTDWPDPTGVADAVYTGSSFLADGHTAAIPGENQVRLVILVTKDAGGNNLWDWRYPVYPTHPDPSIVDVAVVEQQIQVTGGPGVRSIRMAHRGGTWVAFYDGAGLNINAALADADGEAGITGTAVWTVDVDAYGVPKADVTVGVTPSATRATTVYGSGVTSPTTEPQWEVILATAPANLSETMTIRLRAGNLTAETAALYAKSNTGTGWSAEADITAAVSPTLSTAPGSNTDYTWDCGFERSDADPRPRTVTFQIRAELLDGSTVVDNDWDEVSFTTGP